MVSRNLKVGNLILVVDGKGMKLKEGEEVHQLVLVEATIRGKERRLICADMKMEVSGAREKELIIGQFHGSFSRICDQSNSP